MAVGRHDSPFTKSWKPALLPSKDVRRGMFDCKGRNQTQSDIRESGSSLVNDAGKGKDAGTAVSEDLRNVT